MKIISKGYFKSIDEFHILEGKNLGNGSFGTVKLGIHKATGKSYALKVIDLDEVPSEVELKLIEREVKLHSEASHPHITTLWDTLIQKNCLYMVMEYANNGNLFYYQNARTVFSEVEAYLFFSQSVEAVSYLHQNNIMHRDIKPENLLLDQDHNIKLCDFGWSAENITSKRTTFCGTYQYMGPQMLFGTSYDSRIDVWALGILLYQLVHGCAPFKGDSVDEVKERMLMGSYEISSTLSDELKELITDILKFDPEERLSFKEILHSKWVLKIQNIIQTQLIQYTLKNNPLKMVNVHDLVKNIDLAKYSQREKQKEKSNSKGLFREKSAEKKHKKDDVSDGHLKKDSSSSLKNANKNISFNFSINNFAYIKNSEKSKFHSPGEAYERKKKKEEKRAKTLIDEQFFDYSKIKSPKGNSRKRQPKKSGDQEYISRLRRSQGNEEKSDFKFRHQPSELKKNSGKVSSIIKQKSVRDKLTTTVASLKNFHKVKTNNRQSRNAPNNSKL